MRAPCAPGRPMKSLSVTPRKLVNHAPNSPANDEPMLNMLMMKAKSVPSMLPGQIYHSRIASQHNISVDTTGVFLKVHTEARASSSKMAYLRG